MRSCDWGRSGTRPSKAPWRASPTDGSTWMTIVFAAVTRNTAVPPLTGMTSMPVTGTASNLLMPQSVPAKAVPQALAADRA